MATAQLLLLSKIVRLTLLSDHNNKQREITKTWISGQNSCTLVIPKSVAKEYGLDNPSHVIVEGTPKGILIRKLEF